MALTYAALARQFTSIHTYPIFNLCTIFDTDSRSMPRPALVGDITSVAASLTLFTSAHAATTDDKT
jgi:hypothetical protein